MKKILLLITLCLFSFSCNRNNLAEEGSGYDQIEIIEGEITGCEDCSCTEWVKKTLAAYVEKTSPGIWSVHCLKNDGIPYYSITNFAVSIIKYNFFYSDGTPVNNHKNYETLNRLFNEGKFQFYNCHESTLTEEEEAYLECADCPCPDWAKKELLAYREQTPPQIGVLYFMEKDSEVLYYAILNFFSSAIIPNFFHPDGTAISNEHEDYERLRQLFFEGNFRINNACSFRYLKE
jgi:hypothetical protein